jgi:hypothetical protein
MNLNVIVLQDLVPYLSLSNEFARLENVLDTFDLQILNMMSLFMLQAKIELETTEYWLMMKNIVI